MDQICAVYILSNKNKSVLYTGVTSHLSQRIYEHKTKANSKSFTAKYNTDSLVYYEAFESIEDAIRREKQIKGGSRKKKVDLIESINPMWLDLSPDLTRTDSTS